MLSGGDSLQALRLFDYITVTTETASAGLLEVILDGSFSDVLKHVTETHQNPVMTSITRPPEDSGPVVLAKRLRTEDDSTFDPEVPVASSDMRFVVVCRAGDVVFGDFSLNSEQRLVRSSEGVRNNTMRADDPRADLRPLSKSTLPSTDTIHSDRDVRPEDGQNRNSGSDVTSRAGVLKDSQALSLQVCWSSDTGRCVDASPVLLIRAERATVFVGSHSHRMQALDLSSGEVVWERVLGDRLEASAAVSKCGTLVALGL